MPYLGMFALSHSSLLLPSLPPPLPPSLLPSLPPSLPPPQEYLLSRVPQENLRVDSKALDPALGSATLEVGLDNPILEAGFEIICSPTSAPGSLDAVRKTLQVCQVELHPFFVFGHDAKAPLNPQVFIISRV